MCYISRHKFTRIEATEHMTSEHTGLRYPPINSFPPFPLTSVRRFPSRLPARLPPLALRITRGGSKSRNDRLETLRASLLVVVGFPPG